MVENSNWVFIYGNCSLHVYCVKNYVSQLFVLLILFKINLAVGHCKRNKDVLLRNLEEQQEQLERTEYCRKKSSSSVQYRGFQEFLPDETCSAVTKGGTLAIIFFSNT